MLEKYINYVVYTFNTMVHDKYNFNSKEMRCIKDNDELFTKDTLSRVDNVWNKDPWEWLRKVKILKEKKY